MEPSGNPLLFPNFPQPESDRFLVCGLGSLGQHCVLSLKEFGVKVTAIEQIKPQAWEIPTIPELLDDLIIADCRQTQILQQAKIERCRAALLVTTNEQANIETALAIRQLNPHTRLIVRSAKENLNQLLSEQLGNFIAYEPTQLPAAAFAIAALGTETKGFFTLDRQKLRVIQSHLDRDHRWCNIRPLSDLNTRHRRLLGYHNGEQEKGSSFHYWDPEIIVRPGDQVTYIEMADTLLQEMKPSSVQLSQGHQEKYWKQWGDRLERLWKTGRQHIRQIALISGVIVFTLLLIGTFLLRWSYPDSTFLSAFSATAILLLGGYADLFGEFEQIDDIPQWLQLFSLGLTLAGTAFVGVLYALLTETLLSAQFQFIKQRPPIPQENHIVIVGLGRVGKEVAKLLQAFKQNLVGITFNLEFDRTVLPEMPLIVGNVQDALPQGNLATAKSVVVVTDDEILNLEVALMSQKLNPQSDIVIRTAGQQLAQHLLPILPKAQILGTYAVAAEVFAGAAFGENIISIFRLDNRTVLVTEYDIEAGDTLNSLLLADVAYGYGVVPILHQKPPNTSNFMPSDDIQLGVGDRLVVLATIENLKRVEQGELAIHRKQWQVRVAKAFTDDAAFEGANAIARISGCPLNVARTLMNNLPGTLSVPLYHHQGLRLVRELSKLRVTAELIPIIS